ncbi:hypothetical protein [Microbispora sp. SCL1-1]|uniref:hypothetical protein n=1 Tax=Microbispora sp. SCL1-1 TaxID=2592812 RepID=UPI0037C6C253
MAGRLGEGEGDGEGEGVGVGEADGEGVGVGDGVRDGDGEGDGEVTSPVQVTPLRAKPDGTGLEPFQLPLNPKSTLPPLGMAPL